LSLTRSLDVPRVSRYDVDTETPRPEKLVVDFDTTVNSSPTDISGQGNHGVFKGTASYSAVDKAFKFDGAGATYIYRSGASGIPSGDAIYSIVGWVNVEPSITTFGQLLTFGSAWGVSTIGALCVNTSYGFQASIGGDAVKSPDGVITPNTWHHIAAVKVATGVCTVDTYDLYLDGVSITSKTYSGSNRTQNIGTGTKYLSVGGGFTGAVSDPFDGLISNPKLYNVALEPSEVQKLYRLGRTGRSMVISDTAVGIGKVPEAQLDVRGILKASVGLFPDKPFFACEAYRYGLKDNDTTQTLYWHGGDTATLSSVGNMAGSRWKLGVLSGNHTYKTNNVQLVRVLNDSSSETSGVRVPYDGYYHLMHINRTISFNVGSSFVIYSPRHQKYIQTSMNGYRVPWGGNQPGGSGTNSNSVHTSLYLEAGDIVIYIFHNAVIANNFLSGSYEQFVSLVML